MTQASLIFVRVRLRVLSASYKNFPLDSKIMLMNNTMGTEVSGVGMTTKQPAGEFELKLPPHDVPAGDYFLKALDRGGGFLAQSVEFYVH